MTNTKPKTKPNPPVLNIDDVPMIEFGNGEKFAAKLGRLGPALGAKNLGCMLTIVPPGKCAFPFHAHLLDDEMMFILDGSGEYRFGDATYPVKAGDMLGAPPGGAEVAHQLINTGKTDLKYLAFSTNGSTSVVVYPDSDKFLVGADIPQGGSSRDAKFHHLGKIGVGAADYFDGEE
ncbi:MAG: cupin domain-containing protein [Robiginitomaculum sp.]|nr:cupin domain-containing protein [Robiginitomaculum sp.]